MDSNIFVRLENERGIFKKEENFQLLHTAVEIAQEICFIHILLKIIARSNF